MPQRRTTPLIRPASRRVEETTIFTDAQVEPVESTQKCRKRFSFGPEQCERVAGHLGLHRDHVNPQRATKAWGDNECKQD